MLKLTADADLDAVLETTLNSLHEVAGFQWAALMTVDPQTILPTAGVVEGFTPDACGPFWDLELVSPGYHKFTDLARRTDPVATLHDATDGDLRRSPMYTELYSGLGAVDELRVAFLLGSTCWGIASLIRGGDAGPFTDQEVDDVRALARFIARALRQGVLHGESRTASSTAMVVVDGDNRVEHLTMQGRKLLESIRGVQHLGMREDGELPGLLTALVTRARYSQAGAPVTTRIRATTGTWLRVTAAPTESRDGHVALAIEPARSADLLPMVLESHGLTEREVEIVLYLARGLSSKEIAAELSLSPHTIRDHLKAIFRKCRATSRGELIARLFADHLRPHFEESVARTARP